MFMLSLVAGLGQVVAAAPIARLRDTELVHLFADSAAHAGGCCNSGPETFARDGGYGVGDRYIRRGNWIVVANTVCVSLYGEATTCRGFGKDDAGQVFLISYGPTPQDQHAVTPYPMGLELDE